MHNPHTEYEICLSGDINLSFLKKLKYIRDKKKIINSYKARYFDNDDFERILELLRKIEN